MMEDYAAFSVLTDLPTLVRQQRRLEASIVPLAPLVEEEKAVRAQIDELLLKAGIAKGDGVTCLGYDVIHNERSGQSRLNGDTLAAQLRSRGLDPHDIAIVIAMSTEVGDPARWATVKPGKGSVVRAPKPMPSKAARRRRAR